MGHNTSGFRAAVQALAGVVATSTIAALALVLTAGVAAGESNYSGLPAGWSSSTICGAPTPEECIHEYHHIEGAAAPGFGTGALQIRLGAFCRLTLDVPVDLTGLTAASVWLTLQSHTGITPNVTLVVQVAGHTYRGLLEDPTFVWERYDLESVLIREGADAPTTLAALAASAPGPATVSLDSYVFSDNGGGDRLLVDGWSVTRAGETQTVDLEGPTPPTTTEPTTSAPTTAPTSSAPTTTPTATPTATLPTIAAGDTIGPRALKTRPAKGARHVKPRSRIKVQVSEALTAASVKRRTVALVRNGRKMKAKVTYVASRHTIVLKPVRTLIRGSKYVVLVTPKVTDLAGNPWDQRPSRIGAQSLRWAFRT